MTMYYIIEKNTNKRASIAEGLYLIIDDGMSDDEVQRQGWLRMWHITEKMEIVAWHEKFDKAMEL